MTISSNIKITRDGAVLCVTFDRPDKKNALNRAMYMAATEALRQADGDRSIGAVVFTGSGGVFTAGNDIADFLEASAEPGEFPAFTFIKALATCETPLVAAIEGMAIGIGATMTLHCDLVYVAPGTVFRLPFVDLCLVPEAASSLLLPRRIGVAKAAEFMLLGEALAPRRRCGSDLPMPSFRRVRYAVLRSSGQRGSRQNSARRLPPRAASCAATARKSSSGSRKRRGCFPPRCGRTRRAPPSPPFSAKSARLSDVRQPGPDKKVHVKLAPCGLTVEGESKDW